MIKMNRTLTSVSVALLGVIFLTGLCRPILAETGASQPALRPTPVKIDPGPIYGDATRAFQGIPGVAVAPNGRLWAVWYAGGEGEGPENYVIGATSSDGGRTWSEARFVIDPDGDVRAYDPVPWVDPDGRLWVFYSQSYRWWDGRAGVWAVTTDEPGEARPRWSEPRRLADGIMMNKPTVASDGSWLFPIAVWSHEPASNPSAARFVPDAQRHWNPDTVGTHVYRSTDRGQTVRRLGTANIANVRFEEHMIVERGDGSLWLLARTQDRDGRGMAESISTDGGRTWLEGRTASIPHNRSRFFIRRLQSGRLLLVKHNPDMDMVWLTREEVPAYWRERSHLTAYLSDDDGETWHGGLLLDERLAVSYPDGDQGADGRIYLIHDYNRHTDREILLSSITEEDIAAGKLVDPESRLRLLVNKAGSGQ